MGTLNPPVSVQQFKNMFVRDFVYGPGLDTVRDQDVQNGLNLASSVFNPALFSTELVGVVPNQTSEAIQAYCFAAAHWMVLGLQAVGGLGKVGRGLSSQGEGIISSKSVGGVSVSYAWPSSITDSATLFSFTKTYYGNQYLLMLMPRLVGNVEVVSGERTQGIPPNPGFVP